MRKQILTRSELPAILYTCRQTGSLEQRAAQVRVYTLLPFLFQEFIPKQWPHHLYWLFASFWCNSLCNRAMWVMTPGSADLKSLFVFLESWKKAIKLSKRRHSKNKTYVCNKTYIIHTHIYVCVHIYSVNQMGSCLTWYLLCYQLTLVSSSLLFSFSHPPLSQPLSSKEVPESWSYTPLSAESPLYSRLHSQHVPWVLQRCG